MKLNFFNDIRERQQNLEFSRNSHYLDTISFFCGEIKFLDNLRSANYNNQKNIIKLIYTLPVNKSVNDQQFENWNRQL